MFDVDSEGVVDNPDHEEYDLQGVEWILNLTVVQEVVLLDIEVDVEKDVYVKDGVGVVERSKMKRLI